MALMDSKREFPAQIQDAAGVASYCARYFENKGYTVNVERTAAGAFISLTKGGIFKQISGMKTGLNITLTKKPGRLEVSMEVGIFGKQLLPSAISLLVFWPVLIPQIVGLIQQNKLDNEAYAVIENGIRYCENDSADGGSTVGGSFCPYCGKKLPGDGALCPGCGKRYVDENVCPNCGANVREGASYCSRCGTKMG